MPQIILMQSFSKPASTCLFAAAATRCALVCLGWRPCLVLLPRQNGTACCACCCPHASLSLEKLFPTMKSSWIALLLVCVLVLRRPCCLLLRSRSMFRCCAWAAAATQESQSSAIPAWFLCRHVCSLMVHVLMNSDNGWLSLCHAALFCAPPCQLLS